MQGMAFSCGTDSVIKVLRRFVDTSYIILLPRLDEKFHLVYYCHHLQVLFSSSKKLYY